MSINPIAVSLGIPIAAGAIGSGLKLAQQSFHKMLAGTDETPHSLEGIQAAGESHLSTPEQLENVAQRIRDWLNQHGVRLPYTISVTSQLDQPQQIEVESVEREKITELLESIPDVLARLRNLVTNESRLTSLNGEGRTAVVTESSSYWKMNSAFI